MALALSFISRKGPDVGMGMLDFEEDVVIGDIIFFQILLDDPFLICLLMI